MRTEAARQAVAAAGPPPGSDADGRAGAAKRPRACLGLMIDRSYYYYYY